VRYLLAEGTVFTNAFFEGAKASGGRFARADFTGAQCKGADFSDSAFTEATLTGALLVEANFKGCVMSKARRALPPERGAEMALSPLLESASPSPVSAPVGSAHGAADTGLLCPPTTATS